MEKRTPKKLTMDDQDSPCNNMPTKRRKQNDQDTNKKLYADSSTMSSETRSKRQPTADTNSSDSIVGNDDSSTTEISKITFSEPSQHKKGQNVLVDNVATNTPNINDRRMLKASSVAKLKSEKQEESNSPNETATTTTPHHEENHDGTTSRKNAKTPLGTPLPHNFKPSPYSVIIGRGKESKDYSVGNERLRVLVSQHLSQYKNAINRTTMSKLVSSVVSMIREACNKKQQEEPQKDDRGSDVRCDDDRMVVGAFVKLGKDGRWYEVSDTVAREKVGYTFRDMLGERYRSSSRYKVAQKRRLRQEEDDKEQEMGKMEDREGRDSQKIKQLFDSKQKHDDNHYATSSILTSKQYEEIYQESPQQQHQERVIRDDIDYDGGHQHDHQEEYSHSGHTTSEVPPAAYDDDFASEDEAPSITGLTTNPSKSSSSKAVAPSVAGGEASVQHQGLFLPTQLDDAIHSGFNQEEKLNHVHITDNIPPQEEDDEDTFVDPFSSSTCSSSSSAFTSFTRATNTTTSINQEDSPPADRAFLGRSDHTTDVDATTSALAEESLEILDNSNRNDESHKSQEDSPTRRNS